MSPFRSKAQAKYMFSQKPKLAKEFASKTPSIKALPNKVKSGKVTMKMAKTMPLDKLEPKLIK
jgi:hypothetical protein